MAQSKRNRVSVLNWMATILLSFIPGVNLIAALCFIIFGRAASKRSYGVALLMWILLFVVVTVVLLLTMPDRAAQWANQLRQLAVRP